MKEEGEGGGSGTALAFEPSRKTSGELAAAYWRLWMPFAKQQTPYGKFFGKKTEGLYLDLDLLPIEG